METPQQPEYEQLSGDTREMFFEYAIRVTRGRVRVVDVLSALLLMSAVGCGFILVVVVCDHTISGGLSDPARGVLRWGLLLGESVLCMLLIVTPMLRRINDLYVARMIEKANPKFRNDLTSALQLSNDEGVSKDLLLTIRRRASQQVAGANMIASVNLGGLKLASVVLAGVLLVFGGYAIFSPKSVLTSLARVLGNSSLPPPKQYADYFARAERRACGDGWKKGCFRGGNS